VLVTGPHYSVLRIGDWKVRKDKVHAMAWRNLRLYELIIIIIISSSSISIISSSSGTSSSSSIRSRVLPEKLTSS
jgi:hypothetical protein